MRNILAFLQKSSCIHDDKIIWTSHKSYLGNNNWYDWPTYHYACHRCGRQTSEEKGQVSYQWIEEIA